MIIFGSYFSRNAPAKINSVFGYRTARSMRNNDAWKFAHKHFGRNSKRVGWILLAATIVIMLLVFGKEINYVGKIGSMTCGVQVVAIIALIFPTEAALKRNFPDHDKGKTL
jgi:uncharacterized membrane protein